VVVLRVWCISKQIQGFQRVGKQGSELLLCSHFHRSIGEGMHFAEYVT
jgi:hypothetical protein